MIHKEEGTWEIEIPCDCHMEKMVIHKFDDDEDDWDYYYLSFWVDSFYNQSILWWFWDRVKMAWEAIRKGNYIHQEITLNKKKIIELRDNLNEIIKLSQGEDKCDACENLDTSEGCIANMKTAGKISMALDYCPECGRRLK